MIQIPSEIYKKLLDAVLPALENFESLPVEHEVEAIYHNPGFQPKFLQIGNVANEVKKTFNIYILFYPRIFITNQIKLIFIFSE